jgi:regulation of enolase protein 1 (concanavalin A-like superfamily)
MLVSAGKGTAFQRRPVASQESVHTSGPSTTAPYWVKLTRTGSTFEAYASADGSSWTLVGSESIAMGSTIYAGLAVSSHVDGARSTATFTNVTITGTPTLPSGWSQQDIGSVAAAGSGSGDGGAFTVAGSGADIWGTADEFHYVYRSLTGDGSMTARVVSLTHAHDWSKAGVMIRDTLTGGSGQASMFVSAARGLAYQRRITTGGTSTHTSGPTAGAPYWVRIERHGDVITASASSDGVTWTVVGADTIPMAATVYIGLAVTSHADGAIATATFDQVTTSP